MERKKFFTVYYNNGDGCGVEFSSEYHNYITNNYMITEYGTEVYYEDKKIEKFFGTKIIKERKERKVVKKQFPTYVEEVNGKYYDVVTGKEVYKSKDRNMKEILKCLIEKRNGEYYFSCCQGAKVNKEDVENDKLSFYYFETQAVSVESVYNFLKGLTESDIEIYHEKFATAEKNAKKMHQEMMMKILQTTDKEIAQEDYISKFRENNGFGRSRTR